ncbi:restriction endonuclease subunit S [Archaeoglobus veneficus]|uniref:Restriction modification system DNA specificity domain protein n=1 Tax=Archaeoglobus veneficus (strain DSM 11195 / SNP6) TaxID=693661 RepID=F2KRG3_ARCVS|nr:restriction endonuclease subunit S [Archaeoglobus veneficus]AEA47897.1 restriction modification system DNA specificity domain protein [Archaeoglobus veneficus SNP6]
MLLGFKETPIGKIPEDWEVVRLGDVTKVNPESINPAKEAPDEEFYYIEIDSIQNSKIKSVKKIIGKNAPSRARRVVRENDVIMSTVRPYLKAFVIVPKKYDGQICSTGFAVLRCKNELIEPKYLLYNLFMDRTIEQCNRLMVGGQYPALNQSHVEQLKIPLPPLPEQRKIAEILSTVDEAIQKVDEAIVKTERLKKGLMQELLTKGIGHTEFKDTEIGRIPKEWEVVRLGDVAYEFISGGTPSTKVAKYWNGDIPWIRSVHITKFYIDERSIGQYITKEGLENSAAKIIPKNNLIIATRVGIGKSAVNLIDVAINQDLTGIMLNKSKAEPFFLVWYLNSPKIVSLLESFSRGTTIKGIPQDYIKKLLIPLPPLPEQQKIAEILSTVDKKLELERKRKEKLERIKKGLMNDLLTGRRRVKV